ncbi:MAG: type 4a pilus biogenesis protein PilO [Acidobacteriota bacterium]|nr:type 4a pilus biogenesis protein PilO [Acidobacteriota bacterium]
MIEKFKALAWHLQLIVLVCIASIIYFGVWYFVTSGMRAEVQATNDQVAQLITQNEAARVATQRINEFRALYASKTQEYDELKVLLPEEREITNVLQGLQDTANQSKLIVNRFSPRDDTQQEFIMAKPVEIEVDSNFNNLREFFDKMAKLQRIVSITDFKLNQLDKQNNDRTLHAQFLLTAYYAAPENLVNAAKPGVPGQPGAPANPAGAAPGAVPPPVTAAPPVVVPPPAK